MVIRLKSTNDRHLSYHDTMKHKKQKDKSEEGNKQVHSKKKLFLVIIPIIAAAAIGIAIALSSFSLPSGNQGDNDSGPGDGIPEIKISMNPGVPVQSVNLSQTNIIGNPTDAGGNTGMISIPLEDTDEKVSVRFTAKYSGSIDQVVVNLLVIGNSSSDIRAGLQEDDGTGKPTGEWVGQPGAGGDQIDDWGFTEVSLQEPASVKEGRIYHVVIEPTEPEMTDDIRVRMYHLNNGVLPLNDDNLDRLLPDPAINVLHYDGDQWMQQENWPIFVVKYSNGKAMGQPYSLAAPWIIYGSRYVGQEIIPSADYVVEKFGFSVSLSGKPPDNLYYEVRDSANSVLAKGLVGNATQIKQLRKFIEVTLDSPISLKKDQTYRFVLLSPGAQTKNLYQLYGHEFTYDTELSYGGLRQIMTITYDSGSTWIRWEDADAIFDITTR